MRILMASLMALAIASPVAAEPLDEAMLAAVLTNPTLAAKSKD